MKFFRTQGGGSLACSGLTVFDGVNALGIWAFGLELGPQTWDMGMEFGPEGWNLGLGAGIWASKQGIGP